MTILRCPRCGKIVGKILNLSGSTSVELHCRGCRDLVTFEVTQAPDGRLILRVTGDGFHSASVAPGSSLPTRPAVASNQEAA